jgi:hypothetical protein
MLTIDFDPAHPQDALESCACLAEMLGDYLAHRRQDCEMPEAAQASVGALCDAIAHTQLRAASAVRELLAASIRVPLPASPPAKSPAELLAEACGVTAGEAAEMIADGLRHAQQAALKKVAFVAPVLDAAATVAPQAASAPRLTEPRPVAADRRRRAA